MRLPLSLAALTASAALVATSGASFTDSVSVSYEIGTGSLALEHAGDGLRFDAAPLVPGDVARGTVRVKLDGRAAAVTLTRTLEESTAPDGCALRDALRLTVAERGGETVVDAPMASVPESVALGTFAAGEERAYDVTVRFVPQADDNCFMGSADRERFSWTAVEA